MATVGKRKSWHFFAVVACIVTLGGFSLGYFLSNNFTEISRNLDTPQTISSEGADSDEDFNRLISARSLKNLSDASHFGSFFDRTKAILKYVTTADIELVHQLWNASKELQSPKFQEELQHNLIQRWAVLDPYDAIETVRDDLPTRRQSAAIELIYREWSLSNLEDAIGFAQDLGVDHQNSAVTGIVFSREDLSPKQLREIARRLDRELVAIELLKATKNDIVIDFPVQEWNVFVRKHLDRFQNLSDDEFRMLAEIGHSWVLQEGASVFEEMQASLPENTSLLKTVTGVAEELISTHPRIASDFLLKGVDLEQEIGYHELAIEMISRWAKTDPSEALVATEGIKAYSMRRQMHRRVFEQWAVPDPYVLLDGLSELPDNLQNLAQEIALTELAKHFPQTVIGMLGDLTVRGNRDQVAKAIVASWALTDLPSTLEWIASEPLVAHRRGSLKELAFKTLAITDPQLALEIALQQPLKTNGEGWEEDVIDQVILRDMDTAVTMIPRARTSETRFRAYDFAVIVSLFDSDFEFATELFLDLTEEKSRAPNSIDLFSRLAPERLFELLGVIRSVEARTDAARSLLWNQEDKGLFSTAQINLLREIERSEQKELPSRMSTRLREAHIELQNAIEAEGTN
ncbi:MAG: hypothetical protein F4Z87_08405 [Gammaproteobacteria bacterium]|nr:hypothetical protein [Gammaproteobacteria bacterium]